LSSFLRKWQEQMEKLLPASCNNSNNSTPMRMLPNLEATDGTIVAQRAVLLGGGEATVQWRNDGSVHHGRHHSGNMTPYRRKRAHYQSLQLFGQAGVVDDPLDVRRFLVRALPRPRRSADGVSRPTLILSLARRVLRLSRYSVSFHCPWRNHPIFSRALQYLPAGWLRSAHMREVHSTTGLLTGVT